MYKNIYISSVVVCIRIMYKKMVPLVIGFALGHENFLSSLVWDHEYGK